MRSLQAPLSTLVVLASTLPAWLAADGVQLPDAILPQESVVGRDGDLLAHGEKVILQRAPATQRRPQATDVQITRTDGTGRNAEVKLGGPSATTRSTNVSRPTSAPAANAAESDGPRPQVVITDQKRSTGPSAARPAPTGRKAQRQASSSSLASALYPQRAASTNPYGEINDMRGLRPYKPGVRYDRETDGDRDSSVFGLLFGR